MRTNQGEWRKKELKIIRDNKTREVKANTKRYDCQNKTGSDKSGIEI